MKPKQALEACVPCMPSNRLQIITFDFSSPRDSDGQFSCVIFQGQWQEENKDALRGKNIS